MKLENLIPQESSFYLRGFSEEFRLRPVTLADEVWCKNTFNDVGIDLDMNVLCQYVYRLLVDKSTFKKTVVETVDELGDEITESFGGYALLMSMISGEDDKISVVNAFNRAIGIKEDEEEDLEEDDSKKKAI